MGCVGRCPEQQTTSASPDEADGELEGERGGERGEGGREGEREREGGVRERGRMREVTVCYAHIASYGCLPTKGGASSIRPGLNKKSYSCIDKLHHTMSTTKNYSHNIKNFPKF